jgi:hypothetical protein
MPDAVDGSVDGRLNLGSRERKRQILALFALKRNRVLIRLERRLADARIRYQRITPELDASLAKLGRVGESTLPLPIVGILLGFVPIANTAEIAVVEPVTVMFGVTRPILQLIVALALVLTPALICKLAVAPPHRPGSIFSFVAVRTGLACMALFLDGAEVWFRFKQALLVDSLGFGTYHDVLKGNAVGVFIVLLLAKILLTILSAWSLDVLTHYWVWAKVTRKIRRQERKLQELEKALAFKAIEIEADTALIAADMEFSVAEYERGLALGMAGVTETDWFGRLLDGLDYRRAMLTVLNVSALSLITGSLITKVLRPILGLLAIPIGLLSFIVLSTFLILRALSALQHERTGGDGLGTIIPKELAQVAGAALVLFFLVLLTSCSPDRGSVQAAENARDTVAHYFSEPAEYHEGGAIVLLVDMSGSVSVTDEEVLHAAISVIARGQRCDSVSIVPVNAHAGELFAVEIPCKEPPLGFNEDLKTLYLDSETKLRAMLPGWRKQGTFSDYVNAFRLASERLHGRPKKSLIVLGDLIDDQSPVTHERSPRPPLVPKLRGVSLRDTNVYLGLVPSRPLANLSHEDRELFEKNWAAEMNARGAADVLVRSFGLVMLEQSLNKLVGLVNPIVNWSGGKMPSVIYH